LLKALYCVAESAEERDIQLPYVLTDIPKGGSSNVEKTEFEIASWNVRGEFISEQRPSALHMTPDSAEQLVFDELWNSEEEALQVSATPKVELGEDVGFPVTAVIARKGKRRSRYVFDRPEWLGGPNRHELHELGPASGGVRYTAVNVLVLDRRRHMVLLAKRLAGYGAGAFTIPGGKVRPGETILAGAIRELKEETGLELLEADPISLRTGRKDHNSAEVRSVGVLAVKFEGTTHLRSQESSQLGPWDWYDVSRLPQPLFEPASWVIEDYLQCGLGEMSWSTLEQGQERFLPLWQAED
jgi:8-oxo-dGTP diphosphatase